MKQDKWDSSTRVTSFLVFVFKNTIFLEGYTCRGTGFCIFGEGGGGGGVSPRHVVPVILLAGDVRGTQSPKVEPIHYGQSSLDPSRFNAQAELIKWTTFFTPVPAGRAGRPVNGWGTSPRRACDRQHRMRMRQLHRKSSFKSAPLFLSGLPKDV